jgi:hypothetical protein
MITGAGKNVVSKQSVVDDYQNYPVQKTNRRNLAPTEQRGER